MAITSIKRDWGVNPCIVRITSTNTLSQVGTTGYLTAQADNIKAINEGAFEWDIEDMVLVYASDGWGFYTIDPSFASLNAFVFVPGVTLPTVIGDLAMFDSTNGNLADSGIVAADVMTNALASGHLFVGSAGGVATDVALSGDATLIASGALTIADDAVTYAKLQDAAADNVLLGNPGGGAAAEYKEVTLGNGLQFSGGALQIPLAQRRYATVDVALVDFLAMSVTPVQILAAPTSGLINIVHDLVINMHYGSAHLANGGAVGLQYGNTAALGGPPASATEAGTDYTSAGASTVFRIEGGLGTGVAVVGTAATAIYLSNDTAPFITGTGATFTVDVWYSTVPVS